MRQARPKRRLTSASSAGSGAHQPVGPTVSSQNVSTAFGSGRIAAPPLAPSGPAGEAAGRRASSGARRLVLAVARRLGGLVGFEGGGFGLFGGEVGRGLGDHRRGGGQERGVGARILGRDRRTAGAAPGG